MQPGNKAVPTGGAGAKSTHRLLFDQRLWAGITDQIGQRGGAPAVPNFQIADLAGGSLSAAMGILAGLLTGYDEYGAVRRERAGSQPTATTETQLVVGCSSLKGGLRDRCARMRYRRPSD